MICYYVDHRTSWGTKVSLYGSAMFHGYCQRPTSDNLGLEYSYGDKLVHPLCITKNIYDMPLIFQPFYSCNLIVSATVRDRLADLPNISFFRVEFEKLFRESYKKNDERTPTLGVDRILSRRKHNPKLEGEVGDYYELIVANFFHFMDKFEASPMVEVRTRGSQTVKVNAGFFDEHSIFWERGLFFREDVYLRIKKDLNGSMFLRKKIEI